MSRGYVSAPDPFVLSDSFTGFSNKQTAGLAPRFPVINPAQKTLVLLTGGQSLGANVTPTLYTPTNTGVIHQLNIYDGAFYNIAGPVLGATYNTGLALGPGNIFARYADRLVTGGKFDQVLLACTNVGSTTAEMWATGVHSDRLRVAMGRLAERGIVPGMTGVTFGCVFDIGEDDLALGTSQASMTASLLTVDSILRTTGFNGRTFFPQESGLGQTSNNVRSAQSAVVNGTTRFFGGDWDAVSNRQDGVHWNDTGAAGVAVVLDTATASSGAPY